MDEKECQRKEPKRDEGLYLLCRLLIAASTLDGFVIQGKHLVALADLMLRYMDVGERIEAARETKTDITALSELKYVQESLEEGSFGLNDKLKLAQETVNEINDFLDKDLMQIIEFKRYFEKKEKEIRRALAEVDTGAKAQEEAGRKPNLECISTE